MRTWLTLGALLVLVSGVAWSDTALYGWEDGGTVLGMSGTGTPPIIVSNVTDPVHGGIRSLRLQDNSPTGTPAAFVAFIWNLLDGDVVEASFWRYDTTPVASPSCRIWAHWNDELPSNPDGYSGSAGGNDDYGPGTGWDETSWSWTVVDGHTGLVIECRTYSVSGDTVWLDDLVIRAPWHALVQVPSGVIGVQSGTWGQIKALYQ
jgi:hypothetical protein